MSEREWWPEEACDEIMPPGLSSPDQFIVIDGVLPRLDYPLDCGAVDDGERALIRRLLRVGDIVNFICCDRMPEARVAFNEDGWTAVDPIPEGFNWCRVEGDQDTLADTLDELARNLRDDRFLNETLNIQFARWSDLLPHKFEFGADGYRFALVSKAEARQ